MSPVVRPFASSPLASRSFWMTGSGVCCFLGIGSRAAPADSLDRLQKLGYVEGGADEDE